MLQQCANPTCTARFMYLHDGRVFVVESRSADQPNGDAVAGSRQYFWLCNSCLHDFTVRYEPRIARVVVRRKATPEYRKMAA